MRVTHSDRFIGHSASRSGFSGLLATVLLVAAPAAFSDDSEDLARKVAEPTASLKSLNLRYSLVSEFHGLDGSAGASLFQTAIPFQAWGVSNILRATVNYTNSGPAPDRLADVSIFNLVLFDNLWGR